MATTREILAPWSDDITIVPSAEQSFVCKRCLGPVANYEQCYGCFALFIEQSAPRELYDTIVPMTTALNPSRWYSALASYKTFQAGNGLVLASIAYHFLSSHQQRIEQLLGGEPSVITVVPSKRGVPYADQPLRRALASVAPLQSKLASTLRFIPGKTLGRKQYDPSVFSAGPSSVRNQRVALIEDTWVTGATSVSAAGRLLDLGANSVAVLSIARCVNDSFLPRDHPYRQAMQNAIGAGLVTPWPRS